MVRMASSAVVRVTGTTMPVLTRSVSNPRRSSGHPGHLNERTPMSSTTAPTISLAARRPTAPPKPSPSRSAYRPSGETTFGAALRAAANEALVARYTSPNAARIGAPVNPSAGATPVIDLGLPGLGAPATAPAGMDARLLGEPVTRRPVPRHNARRTGPGIPRARSPVGNGPAGRAARPGHPGHDRQR